MTAPDIVTPPPPVSAVRSPSAILFRKLFGRRVVLAGAIILVIVALAAIFAPWLTPYDATALKVLDRLQSPRATHWFGTDELGRDVFSRVVFGALMGALAWNIITWYYGIPSSSSHALVGGLVGATLAKAGGVSPIVWSGFGKILAFIIISPLVGFFMGGMLMVLVAWVFRDQTPHQANRWFRSGQLVAAAAYSLGHGGNDAQKTIGIIWLLLITAGAATTDVSTLPNWVIYSCYGAIAWGTYLGGWRIVKTMGTKITRLTPVSGSCASMSGALSLALATLGGVPVSTTHTITGAIVGVGMAQDVKAVRWAVTFNLVFAWIVTIPAAGLIAAVFWAFGRNFLGGTQ